MAAKKGAAGGLKAVIAAHAFPCSVLLVLVGGVTYTVRQITDVGREVKAVQMEVEEYRRKAEITMEEYKREAEIALDEIKRGKEAAIAKYQKHLKSKKAEDEEK